MLILSYEFGQADPTIKHSLGVFEPPGLDHQRTICVPLARHLEGPIPNLVKPCERDQRRAAQNVPRDSPWRAVLKLEAGHQRRQGLAGACLGQVGNTNGGRGILIWRICEVEVLLGLQQSIDCNNVLMLGNGTWCWANDKMPTR